MTTYELIRMLVKLDPDGDSQVMLSVRTTEKLENGNLGEKDACGFVQSVIIETPDECGRFLVLEATDA